ncbi:MAG: folylpolyglutamate synthase/dihydrofolate synthase family protein [Herpetosiphon sp.]
MSANDTYQLALDYLYSFINYESKLPPSTDHARFNLDRLRCLLQALGDPQLRWPAVVIAGTKGKGSTAAMIESILRAAGLRTGLFISPHLHSWRERVQVERRLIDAADVVRLVEMLKTHLPALPSDLGRPTTFELATALAWTYFAEQQIDFAVLEVGMGGRFDTVNVVTPLVSVITPISFDHMATLGNTLPEIAAAKAGIIKPAVPVVTAPQHPEAAQVIALEADTQHAPLWFAEPDALVGPGSKHSYPIPLDQGHVNLIGDHQILNARVACGVVSLLSEQGISIPPTAWEMGLGSVEWPGRFEIIALRPTIVVDGAMNAASAVCLLKTLSSIPHRRLLLVLGTSADKDVAAIADVLVPAATTVIVTRSTHPRAADPAVLAHVIADYGVEVLQTPDVPEAIELSRRLADPADLICVTGSLFVVAAAREATGRPYPID